MLSTQEAMVKYLGYDVTAPQSSKAYGVAPRRKS
jgi:hypothetical protein